MNQVRYSLWILAAAALAGCAAQDPVVVNQVVGPDLARPAINQQQNTGQLVVYTALESADPVSSDYPTHASYEIYDSNGKFVKRVDNRSGSFYQSPKAVSLPPGQYMVKGPATNHGLIQIAVLVKEGETTTLDLDATHFRQHKPTGAGQWVRLPSGEVVGMRAP